MNSDNGSEPIPAELVVGVINSLFAVGLDLAATSTLVEGDAAERLSRAIHALDDVIAVLRDNATKTVNPLTVDRVPKPPPTTPLG